MGFQPAFETEGRVFAKYILEHHPNARVGVIAVNNDLGQNSVRGLRAGLGKAAEKQLDVASIEFTDATVDSQVIALQAAGAEVLITWATPRASTQTIRKLHDLDWHPVQLLSVVNSSIKAVLEPAGLENSVGIISTGFLKQPLDPSWKEEPGVRDYLAWMKAFYPEGDPSDLFNAYAYTIAQAMVEVLKRCGDDLTRENVMRQATSLRDLELPLLLPGIKVNTSASKYRPVDQLQLLRFDGKRWVPIGEVMKP
jgi:ABC-type branched-subunit amino acid transport system substrate-binding protein